MSTEKKIIVLNLPDVRHPGRNTKPKQITPRRFRLYLKFLHRFGYQFKTISDALHATNGKYCCIVVDSADKNARDLVPMMHTWKVPGTLMVATSEIDSPERGAGLTWNKIRRLVRRRWEIGTFGARYEDLTQLPHQTQVSDIRQARDTLLERLGAQPEVFGYPYGALDTSVLKALKDHGFCTGLMQSTGVNFRSASRWHLKHLRLSGKFVKDLLMLLRWNYRAPVAEPAVLPQKRPQTQRTTA